MAEQEIPVGYRFIPTDEILIDFYLRRKVTGGELPHNSPIVEKDLYDDKPPWDVFTQEDYKVESDEKSVIYVYTKLKKASKKRISRRAGCGTWVGQKKVEVKNSKNETIGYKSLLSFRVIGDSVTKKTTRGRWIMHEFSLSKDDDFANNENHYVVCRIKNVDAQGSGKRKFEESNDHGGDEEQSGQTMSSEGVDSGLRGGAWEDEDEEIKLLLEDCQDNDLRSIAY